MYGTIAKLRFKPGMEAAFERYSQESSASIPGLVFDYLYRLDSDPLTCYLVVGFTDRDAYRRNAESPEQHARYEEYRAMLDAEPEWNDGEIAFAVTR